MGTLVLNMLTDAQFDLTVDAAPTAARDARHAVARRNLVSSGQEATLLLLVSELVSNSVRHAGLAGDEHIRLRARIDRECAYVEVCDAGRSGHRPARRENQDALVPGGLGLVLVDEMADRWGVACNDDETCVWFELACA
jgi:anti-sigma regulatory factor (Ser/Thr protein kinase)